MTSTGKIARLPNDIRTQLNLRLQDGQDGPKLLEWLNAQPEVQGSLEESFDGAPITKQNLSEWRNGGFPVWQIRQEFIDHACELYDSHEELTHDVDASLLAGKMAALLATRYAALLNSWDGETDEKFEAKLRVLRIMNRDIALLQKTLSQAHRQQREQDEAQDKEEQRELEAEKERTTAPIWAYLEADAMAAQFNDGAHGRNMAEILARTKYNLPPPENWEETLQRIKEERAAKAEEAKKEKSKPVAPSRTKSRQEEADSGAEMDSPGQEIEGNESME